MATASPAPRKQLDRKTVCLGETLADVERWLKAGKGRRLSTLVRQAIRAYLHPSQRPLDTAAVAASVDALRLDLARVGSNLNQLAHGFHLHGPVAFDRDALAAAHADLTEEFRKVVAGLIEVQRAIRRHDR